MWSQARCGPQATQLDHSDVVNKTSALYMAHRMAFLGFLIFFISFMQKLEKYLEVDHDHILHNWSRATILCTC